MEAVAHRSRARRVITADVAFSRSSPPRTSSRACSRAAGLIDFQTPAPSDRWLRACIAEGECWILKRKSNSRISCRGRRGRRSPARSFTGSGSKRIAPLAKGRASSSGSRSARRSSRRRESPTAARHACASSRRRTFRPGSSWPAKSVRSGARGRSTSSSRSTACRAAASASASRRTASAFAPSRFAGVEDDRQLENAVRFRAHTRPFSIPLDEAVLDYHVLSETVDEAGKVNRRILVVAAYHEVDRPLYGCLQGGRHRAGRDRPRGVRAAARRGPAPTDSDAAEAAVVAVTIGHDRSTLAISDSVVCDFARVLEWGGSSSTAQSSVRACPLRRRRS